MCPPPNGEDSLLVVAICPSTNGEDFSIVVTKCPFPNGEDFSLVTQVSKVEIFRVLILLFGDTFRVTIGYKDRCLLM